MVEFKYLGTVLCKPWSMEGEIRYRTVKGRHVMGKEDKVIKRRPERMLQRIVDEFDSVCKRRKLKVNAGKSKVMVFQRARAQTIDFAKPYRVGSETTRGCKILLEKEKF